jgi:hypothetical protein
MFYILGVFGVLFSSGIGLYIMKNARDISEDSYHDSGDAFGLGFWLWITRIWGIFAFGFAIFGLFVIFSALLFP